MSGETILQFGTGRFLRAFVDVFLQEIGSPAKLIAVQSTGNDRIKLLHECGFSFPVAIRGVHQGQRVDRVVQVRSICMAYAASDQWPDVLTAVAESRPQWVVSNATEAAYQLSDHDSLAAEPPASFPGKLLAILRTAYESGQRSIHVCPCELVENNADKLRLLVTEQARRWKLPDDFVEWLHNDCQWHNTLVDRIAAAPQSNDPLAQHPLAVVTEPFALWAVERLPADSIWLRHADIVSVADIGPYFLRKVRILNGAHTALVARALPRGFQTVRQAVEDTEMGRWLRELIFEEIVPVLEERCPQPAEFAQTVLERFLNPFIDHYLDDIALYHDTKMRLRLLPTYEDYRRKFGKEPPRLKELLKDAGLI